MRTLFKYFLTSCFFLSPFFIRAQVIPFNSSRWDISAEEYKIDTFFGKQGIFLKNGSAVIKDSHFLNGIIEFDIAVANERGFMGTLFRIQDEKNCEEFYIRPHQSGQPDANQYSPVFNGDSGWQLYYGEDYSAPVTYNFNQWMHIKIIVADRQAEIYIMDMENPVLFIPQLKRVPQQGKIAIYTTSGFAPAYFSNFSYTDIANPGLKSKPKPPKTAVKGTVLNWLVSNPFNGNILKDKYSINSTDLKDLKWTKLSSEATGIANLARIEGPSKTKNTVFTRLVINSKKEQIKAIKFGYSDDVKVFVNGSLIYGGTNIYRSRDHRYLGTIGLFDEIYPHLKKGEK